MTISEILTKAAINTGLGMGTVFAMLLLISVIISLFRLIPQNVVSAAEPEPLENDDEELASVVIAAVLAAAEDQPREDEKNDSYIVRSIRRR